MMVSLIPLLTDGPLYLPLAFAMQRCCALVPYHGKNKYSCLSAYTLDGLMSLHSSQWVVTSCNRHASRCRCSFSWEGSTIHDRLWRAQAGTAVGAQR